jgi:hypothetical protein
MKGVLQGAPFMIFGGMICVVDDGEDRALVAQCL